MLRRLPIRIVAIVVVALVALSAIGFGLLRAATYDLPPASSAGGQASGPSGCGGATPAAPRELRGMWLTTVNNIDWPSKPGLPEAQVKKEYLAWLDMAVSNNHNAIFVHVRPSGDALWPSKYAPWSEWLTGKRDGADPGWDPMKFMIDEAHARNLEFHAWFNPYRGSQPAPAGAGADFDKLAPNHPLRQHRDWAIVHPKGDKGRFYYDPGNPEARQFVEDSMLEAVQKYDVDGVHFDDFFYPYPKAGEDFADDASFAKRGRSFSSRAAWRRDNVNTLVREMHERIKETKPWVKFGISPFGIWRNAANDPAGSDTRGLESNDAIYADTRTWVREGWLDYVVPQLYWAIGFDKADYAKVLPWWTDLVEDSGVQLYIGQGDYRIGEKGPWRDPAQLTKQLDLNAKYPAVQGSVHFSAKQIRADRLGGVTRYREAHYAGPALMPLMKQLPADPPSALRVTGTRPASEGGTELRWEPGETPPVSWALYRVDAGQAALIGTGRAAPVVAPGPGTYCVAGLDRSGNQGELSGPVTVSP